MLTDRRTDRRTDRQTDGHTNLIVRLVTRNPPKNQSTPLKFENSTRITSEKLHDAIHLGSTSILLINTEKWVKMSQTWPFWPWQWPLEWFNQILLFTVCCHHTGEASCQNRGNITQQSLNKCQNWRKVANLDLSDLEKWPLERFNQIQLWVVD